MHKLTYGAVASMFKIKNNIRRLPSLYSLHCGNYLCLRRVRLCKSYHFRSFGICFDIDGVILRGSKVISAAQTALLRLQNSSGNWKSPIVFLTNGLGTSKKKAAYLSDKLEIKISPDQVLHAPSALKMFSSLHKKHCLVIGHGDLRTICEEVGFENISLMSDIQAAYPLLDVLDKTLDYEKMMPRKALKRIEAIIIVGEPNRWEAAYQIIYDLVRTNGLPTSPSEDKGASDLPVVACNLDLQYVHQTFIERLGNGAFYAGLEAIYKRSTGQNFKYFALLGKPSPLTFKFAEVCLQKMQQATGQPPIKTMYMIGDNPLSDIAGANMYHRCLGSDDPSIYSQISPDWLQFAPVKSVKGLLVESGVYNLNKTNAELQHSHRDIALTLELITPHATFSDVDGAVEYILEQHE